MSNDNKNAMLHGDRLREAREYLGLSIDFVVAHLRWQASYLQALEQGEHTPDTQEIASLARLYCCDPASLIGMIDDQAETLPDAIGVMLNCADMSELDRAEVLRFYHFLIHAPTLEE